MSRITIDFHELQSHAETVETTLEDFLIRMEEAIAINEPRPPGGEDAPAAGDAPKPGPKEKIHLEQLFSEARGDRSRAYELKQELDRLGLFDDYEDRFLDLFREP